METLNILTNYLLKNGDEFISEKEFTNYIIHKYVETLIPYLTHEFDHMDHGFELTKVLEKNKPLDIIDMKKQNMI